MIDGVVRELHLDIRAPPGAETETRTAAERFSRRVLDAAVDRLEQRLPGRLVLVRELAMHCTVSENDLDSPSLVTRYAEQIARRLAAETPLGLSPGPVDSDRDAVVFDDEAHWRAAHLLARSSRSAADAWFFADLDHAGDPLEQLAEPENRALGWPVLERLAAAGVLAEVLGAQRPDSVGALARVLLDGEAPSTGASHVRLEPEDVALIDRLVSLGGELPACLPPPGIAMAVRAQAAVLLGSGVNSDRLRALAAACLERLGTATVAEGETEAAQPEPADSVQKPEGVAIEEIAIEFGGLFYLLNCALELGLGEILWRACLAEPRVLAAAAAGLLAAESADEESSSLFASAARPTGPGPPDLAGVAEEQQHEVAATLLAAVAAALPRRGLAELPEARLALTGHRAGRLLVAHAADSPFAIFAWPAETAAALRLGIETFLQSWSAGAPKPRAEPPLFELDRGGRLLPVTAGTGPSELVIPRAQTSTATALLAQAIGSLCHLFVARTGDAGASAAAFIERYLRLPARVRLEAERMTVLIAAEDLDLGVRRAGLDRDPGWVPWLGRSVQFFFGDEEAVRADSNAVPSMNGEPREYLSNDRGTG